MENLIEIQLLLISTFKLFWFLVSLIHLIDFYFILQMFYLKKSLHLKKKYLKKCISYFGKHHT